MPPITCRILTISKLFQSWGTIALISCLTPIWTFQQNPTIPSIMNDVSDGNIGINSVIHQEINPIPPVVHADPDTFQAYNFHQSHCSTNHYAKNQGCTSDSLAAMNLDSGKISSHQDLYFDPDSQYGRIETQTEPSMSDPKTHQETTLAHIHNFEASLPTNEIDNAGDIWKHPFDIHLNDPFSSMPFSRTGHDLLGWETPRAYEPEPNIKQHSQDHGQEYTTRPSYDSCETLEKFISKDILEKNQDGSAKTDHKTCVISDNQNQDIPQTQLSKGQKRDLLQDKGQDDVIEMNEPPEDHSQDVENMKKKANQKKRLSKKPKVQKSQELTNTSSDITQNQYLSSTVDISNELPNDSTIPTMKSALKSKDVIKSLEQSTLTMLKDIGAFHVGNSLVYAYEIAAWFKTLKEDMLRISGQGQQVRKAVHRAIECAHQWVTMSLFGLISIQISQGLDKSSSDKISDHAWKHIQTVFGQWRHMWVGDMKYQRFPPDGDWQGPVFLFRYLSKLTIFQTISLEIVASMVVILEKDKKTAKILMDDIINLYNEAKSVYNKDLMFIQGGLFSRGSIGNLEFEEMNIHSVPRKSHLASKSTHRAIDCKFISHSAKFLSPVGIQLCQDVHGFFVDLIQELLNKYQISNKLDLYSAQKIHLDHNFPQEILNQHEPNMENIVKVVSLAEYRITVGFIGIIRSIYEKALTDTQMETIIKSAWDFLKKEFSKWKCLDFKEGRDSIFVTQSYSSSWKSMLKDSGLDPKVSFQILCKRLKYPSNSVMSLFHLNIFLVTWFQEDSDRDLKHALGPSFAYKMMHYNSLLSLVDNP
ncbi:hypothetical protein DFH28DRAFT_327239 [Melampsora americana]|nr:hypothetical protein DFH28DRAFT_327239 [Melampsora americana]